MKCKCGANLYRISGLTRYDNRDGIREAAWCDSCYTLFSSHAFGLSEIGKLTDTNKIDQLRARIAELGDCKEECTQRVIQQAKRMRELKAEVERLRKAIATHKNNVWGRHEVAHNEDVVLYTALEASNK